MRIYSRKKLLAKENFTEVSDTGEIKVRKGFLFLCLKYQEKKIRSLYVHQNNKRIVKIHGLVINSI